MCRFDTKYFVLCVAAIVASFITPAYAISIPEPVSWEQLQIIQQDSLLSAADLGLANTCPSEVQIQPKDIYFQNILYTNYRWSEHYLFNGSRNGPKKCVVLWPDDLDIAAVSIDFLSAVDLYKELHGVSIRYLSTNQAQVLLSAGRATGFEEKGFYEEAINAQQQINDFFALSAAENCNAPLKNEIATDDAALIDIEEHHALVKSSIQDDYDPAVNSIVFKPLIDDGACAYDPGLDDMLLNRLPDMASVEPAESRNVDPPPIFDNRYESPLHEFPYALQPRIVTHYTGQATVDDLTSGIYISPFSVLVAAHAVSRNDSGFLRLKARKHTVYLPFQDGDDAVAKKITHPNYNGSPSGNSRRYDYGALQMAKPFLWPVFLPINIVSTPYTGSEFLEISGYPQFLYFGGNQTANNPVLQYQDAGFVDAMQSNSEDRLVYTRLFSSRGVSDAPTIESIAQSNIIGVQTGVVTQGGDSSKVLWSVSVDFDSSDVGTISNIVSHNPTGVIVPGQNPSPIVTYDLITIPAFEVIFIPFGTPTRRPIDPQDIVWDSNLNGEFGTGEFISTENLQTNLTTGIHELTISIDTDDNNASRSLLVEITGPSGELNLDSFCAVNLQFPAGNTCSVPMSWNATDLPEGFTPVIINSLTSAAVASGINGSVQVTVGTTPTTFTLHESNEQILTLAEATTEAKIPTGNLSSNLSTCAIEPRADNQDPQGCDATLEWSNLRYADPFIYYRHANGTEWFQLGESIQCGQGPCSGSINTADVIPELIRDTGGVVLELKQFLCNDSSCSNSGTIGQPVHVNAIVIADEYEFDDTINHANTLALNSIQSNHSFHKPAPQYGLPEADIDMYILAQAPFGQSPRLQAETFGIAAGLQTQLSVACYGDGLVTPPGGEPQSAGFGAYDLINANIQITGGSQPGSRVISWNTVRNMSFTDNGNQYTIFCSGYVLTATRSAGTPGPDLTYSVRYSVDDEPVTIGAISGSWYNPDRDGEGWFIEELGGGVVSFYWFTYPPVGAAGQQRWLLGVGNKVGNRFTFNDVRITHGARFGTAFDPDDVVNEHWGSIEFVFSDDDNAVISYSGPPEYGNGSIAIQPLSSLYTGNVTGPLSAGISGSWSDPVTDGEGWGIHAISRNRMLVYWFTYDNAGNQAWNAGVASVSGNQLILNGAHHAFGAHFGNDFDPDDVTRQSFGNLLFTFDSCNNGTMTFDTIHGTGTRTLRRITNISGITCTPF